MTGSADERKAAKEREVFKTFVVHLGEQDDWIAIESQPPPEPDLLCRHAQRGLIAFELVAITDPSIAAVNAGFAKEGQAAFTTSDPSERIIRKKLKRRYKTEHPLELLVYNDLLVITPDQAIIDTILPWIGSLDHPFRRVWYMGEHRSRSIWNSVSDGDMPAVA